MPEETGQSKDQGTKPTRKIAPIAVVSFISLVVVGIAAYAAVYLARNIGKIPPEEIEAQRNSSNAVSAFYHKLEPFQTNLASPNESKIVRAEFTLEFAVDKEIPLDRLQALLRDMDSKIRDVFIGILCSKRVNDITDLVGKEKMKAEIKKMLNAAITWPDGVTLRAVLLLNFVIQF